MSSSWDPWLLRWWTSTRTGQRGSTEDGRARSRLGLGRRAGQAGRGVGSGEGRMSARASGTNLGWLFAVRGSGDDQREVDGCTASSLRLLPRQSARRLSRCARWQGLDVGSARGRERAWTGSVWGRTAILRALRSRTGKRVGWGGASARDDLAQSDRHLVVLQNRERRQHLTCEPAGRSESHSRPGFRAPKSFSPTQAIGRPSSRPNDRPR